MQCNNSEKAPTQAKRFTKFCFLFNIGNSFLRKALCNLGENINLMPFSMFKQLGLGEPKPTMVSLQMANHSIKCPRGVTEGVLVKVDELIFFANFVVLDIKEEGDIPIILG